MYEQHYLSLTSFILLWDVKFCQVEFVDYFKCRVVVEKVVLGNRKGPAGGSLYDLA